MAKEQGTVLVACETIEDEVNRALRDLGLDYPVVWLEGGLHNSPDRLRKKIQEVFDQADGRCERLLVSLGFCGGGVSGLSTGSYRTVLPMADDCLSLLLGSMAARKDASRIPTYFLTSGWMRHENNVVTSYRQTVERYGQQQADRVNRLMLKNYRRFGLVTTGCYCVEEAAKTVEPFAAKMSMDVETIEGRASWLEGLLTGPHDEPGRFVVLPPCSQLNFNNWCELLMGDPSLCERPISPEELAGDPIAGEKTSRTQTPVFP
jgi:hypothetical protein